MNDIYNYFLHSQPKLSKTSLAGFQKFVAKAGNPFENFKTIHIAWTNGKGSVAQMLFSILKTAGYNVGIFTSPHLIDLRERIKTSKWCISLYELAKIVEYLKKIDPANQLGFFEKLTLASQLHFANQKVDYAIIETWMWGRLDPTNVISDPIITTITSIWWDHTHILGNTLKKIAYEKAGIIKDSVPVVVNFQNQIIKKVATQKKAPLIRVYWKKATNLHWDHQQKNAALAYKIGRLIWIDKNTIKHGLLSVAHPWRLQYLLPNLLIDWAHNQNWFKVLKNYLDQISARWSKTNLIITLKQTKNPDIVKKNFDSVDAVLKIYHPFLNQSALAKKLDLPLISPQLLYQQALKNPQQLFVVFWSLYWIWEFLKELKAHHLYEPSTLC